MLVLGGKSNIFTFLKRLYITLIFTSCLSSILRDDARIFQAVIDHCLHKKDLSKKAHSLYAFGELLMVSREGALR